MIVKEANLVDNGEMVTPVCLLNSIYMQDGRKLIDVLNDILKNVDGTVLS